MASVSVSAAALFIAQLTMAPPAQAAFPGGNGRIVAVGNEGGLYSMNLGGAGRVTLRKGGSAGYADLPVWSPDGGRIAFYAYADHAYNVFVMNSNGTDLHQVTTIGGANPAWSPDGTKLVFAYAGGCSGCGAEGLYVINADGTNLLQLTTADDYDAAWSPDGSTIVFRRYDGHIWKLWTMDSNGDNETQLTTVATSPGDKSPSWSPDGTKIAFERETSPSPSQIYTMSANGSNVQPLTDSGGNSFPKWSPDGTKIAFTSTRGHGLWTMNPDGTGQVRATSTPDLGEFDWQPLHLTLRSSKATVTHPNAVTLTAHLNEYLTTSNSVVSIYRVPLDGPETLVASGTVSPSGDFSTTTKPVKATSFVARWTGDADGPAGGQSLWVPVAVRVAVSGHFSRFYGRSGKFFLYHFTSACPGSGRRCPTYTGTVRPNHAGYKIVFVLQIYLSGGWRPLFTGKAPIGSKGSATVRFVYPKSGAIGLEIRLQTRFRGDADHLGNRSSWSYFKVTS